MSEVLGPLAICRLDASLLERIARGHALERVALSAALTIGGGAALYGTAFGLWRGPAQALYSAVKLPALLLAVAAGTLVLSAMLASVLRSRLSLWQTAVCILLSLAVTSVVLGALAPLGILMAMTAPPPDPAALGLPIDDPRVASSLSVARSQLLVHVAVIAGAGMVGVVRLRGLLARLGLPARPRRRVLVSFLAIQFAVGVELAWLFRPFFGRPHLPPSFSCDDLLRGNFFEEIAASMRPAFGIATTPVLVSIGVAIVFGLLAALRVEPSLFRAELGEGGLALFADGEAKVGARHVTWRDVAGVRRDGPVVEVRLALDETLEAELVRVDAGSLDAADALASRIETERTRAREGPFRTLGSRASAHGA